MVSLNCLLSRTRRNWPCFAFCMLCAFGGDLTEIQWDLQIRDTGPPQENIRNGEGGEAPGRAEAG